ncbi:DUF3768 domain-containing protein [Bradyrhizobium sp. SZCCHNRI3043]|uniref:DUF3768 domain-containing protein n=1 Tax=Bradyrhizobium sp. SZCCHNRI3043 TaxID=3057292 RepID=UPI0028EB97D1|nr:DUF3768 domain-containing protein [Bradyrhizobium sp. SZCCHNRI3043]
MSVERIRALNDQLRTTLTGGKAFMTPGIAALGPEAVQRLVTAIAMFDDFCVANDPHGEHDFGMFEFEGSSIIFKIEYLDASFEFGSPDPADPTVTQRVITLMLADEY